MTTLGLWAEAHLGGMIADTLHELGVIRQQERAILAEGDTLIVPLVWGRAVVLDRPRGVVWTIHYRRNCTRSSPRPITDN